MCQFYLRVSFFAEKHAGESSELDTDSAVEAVNFKPDKEQESDSEEEEDTSKKPVPQTPKKKKKKLDTCE